MTLSNELKEKKEKREWKGTQKHIKKKMKSSMRGLTEIID